jgi:hypothetical protein
MVKCNIKTQICPCGVEMEYSLTESDSFGIFRIFKCPSCSNRMNIMLDPQPQKPLNPEFIVYYPPQPVDYCISWDDFTVSNSTVLSQSLVQHRDDT